MRQFLKVSGRDGLVRDMSTGAIINNNSSEFENYQNQQIQAQKRKDQIAQQETDKNNIKSYLSDIKQILLSLIEKNSSKG